jgi:UDP-2-acetamido-3-amino-2,3-dideoxy-glucuronate N-acetyltransferase
VAVLGAGGWGMNHVRTLHQLGALVAVCDPDPDRRSAVEKAHAGVEVCADPADVLDRADIAGVVLATPAATHAELGLAAVDAGKDILVEKPLALTLDDATSLVEAAEKARRILMVGHVLEYHPAVEALRRLVADGSLGPLRWASSNRLSLGKVRTVENVLWSFAVHDIALLTGLIGADPEQVSCRGGDYLSPGIEDVALLGLTFPGGVEAQISVSWLHPTKEQRLVLVGERAMAIFDDTVPAADKLTLVHYEIDRPAPTAPGVGVAETVAVPVHDDLPLTRECRHFLARIADRERPLTDGVSGLRVLRVLEAADRSMATGGFPVIPASDAHESPAVVHATATVDDGALLGPGTRVWHYSHVMSGAVIGKDCSLGQNVFVGRGVCIGNGVKIQNNVSVYEGVVLEDGVFCGPSMVFTNVMTPRAEINRKNEYRTTLVRRGATLGANCTVVCGVTIGEYAFVGAGSLVSRDVPAYALVMGVPARQRGWVCACGEKLPVGDVPACVKCGRRYRRNTEGVVAE